MTIDGCMIIKQRQSPLLFQVHRGGSGHGHVHHHHHRSSGGYKAQFSLTVPIDPGSAAADAAASSVPAQANPGFLLPPPPPAGPAHDDHDRERRVRI